jgi:hypothetical protein
MSQSIIVLLRSSFIIYQLNAICFSGIIMFWFLHTRLIFHASGSTTAEATVLTINLTYDVTS